VNDIELQLAEAQAECERLQRVADVAATLIVDDGLNELLDMARAEGAAAERERCINLRDFQARYDALVAQLGDEIVTHVVLCATEHANFEAATLPMLQEEVNELSAALRGEHEHSPESELIQIAAIAINWIRQLGNIPSREFIVSEAQRHQYNRGYAEGAAAERERCIKAICSECAAGNEVHIIEGQHVHWVATVWLHNRYVPCKAAAIRSADRTEE